MGEQGLVKQRVEEGYAEGRTRRRLEVDVGGVLCLLRIKTTHESVAQERGATRQEGHREAACPHLHEDSKVVFADVV